MLIHFLVNLYMIAQYRVYAFEFAGTKKVDCGTNFSLNNTDTTITPETWVFQAFFSINQWEKVAVNKLAESSHRYNLNKGGNGIVEVYFLYPSVARKSIYQALYSFN